jgi:hypothetical protein
MNREQAFIISDRIIYLESRVYAKLNSKEYVKRRSQLIDRLLEKNE